MDAISSHGSTVDSAIKDDPRRCRVSIHDYLFSQPW